MSLEKTIQELTAKTPSGGTCWIEDIPFTVWFGSDYWEWEFQGVFYFDLQDLSEAMEAHLRRISEAARQAVFFTSKTKLWPIQVDRKRITFPSKRGPTGLVSGPLK